MSTIAELWREGHLPIRDALHLTTGESRDVVIKPRLWSGIEILGPFDLDAHLAADPEWVTSIDVTHKLDLAAGGRLCCGEGSHGSEGFIARTDQDGKLLWVVYLELSNPFIEIQLMDGLAVFRSSSDVVVRVDPDNPLL